MNTESDFTPAFASAVQKLATKHLAEFDLVGITKRSDYEFTADLPHFQVVLILDRGQVGVALRPRCSEPDAAYTAIGLAWLVAFSAPDQPYHAGWLRGPDDIHPALGRELAVLVQHCRSVLSGDASNWPSIQAFTHERVIEAERARERRAHLSRVRSDVLRALQAGDDARAVELLESIETDLRPVDRRTLDKARQRLGRPSL